jgi:splicing factor 3A subunit 3
VFSKDTVFKAHLQAKKHLQNQEKMVGASKFANKHKNHRKAYESEYLINALIVKFLLEQLDNTKINIQKKQSMTANEYLVYKEEEEKEEEIEEYDPEEELPGLKMTIDNYPVGWDGKPIPYWLYKLHGLGVEYKCEICGNTSYYGRGAYEKHFQEWRHAFGMRCLNIPNTKHFHDVTKINDAIALWNKLRKDKWEEAWRPEAEEEFEDREGNVFNKKTYEDLKRQGLL